MKITYSSFRYKFSRIKGLLACFIFKFTKFGKNFQALEGLKNSEKGKTCFVVANGPSLKMKDLDKLHKTNTISIASNKIYLCFDDTKWRPTYYTVADYLNAENDNFDIDKLNSIKLIPYSLKFFFNNHKNTIYFNERSAEIDNGEDYVPGFSFEATKGLHVGETVTHLNIQIALYLGCNPIYIIGMDGEYKVPPDVVRGHNVMGDTLESDNKNHFCANYYSDNEKWAIPRVDLIHITHDFDDKAVKSKNVNIFNASRKSAIGSFERVNMSEIKL